MTKKFIIILTTVLSILVLAGFSFYMFFIFDTVDKFPAEKPELEAVVSRNGSLNISIDPRIELLSALQLVSGYKHLGSLSFKYRDDMQSYFDAYKDHDAIRHFNWLSGLSFSYDAPPHAMLHLSPPPALLQKIQYDIRLKQRGVGTINLDRFAKLTREFSSQSGFPHFYKSNEAFYRQVVDSTSGGIGNEDLVKVLEDYYGTVQNSYNLILAPLFHQGGYGIRTADGKGSYDTYAIVGPYKTENGIPVYDANEIRSLIWHEFSHSFVNPLTEKNIREVNKHSSLFKPIEDTMRNQAYGTWQICVNEHVVRAVTTRLAYIVLGKTAGDNEIDYHKQRGFMYIEELCKKLEEYEKNRDTYKTLENFYPELIKAFD